LKLFLKSLKLKKSASIVTSIALLAGFTAFVTPAQGAAPVGAGFVVSESDLSYILDQIKIADAHATTQTVDRSAVVPGTNPFVINSTSKTDIPNNLLQLGLRQIDGRNNNLTTGYSTWNGFEYLAGGTVGKSTWGSAGQPFKRTTPVSYKGAFGSGGTRAGAGNITDNEIRTISNLIADQSSNNPAAVAAARPGAAEEGSALKGTNSFLIPNVSVNAGVNAPNSGIFSLFGQFFDHGLDLVGKSATQKIKVCLKADDPLVISGAAHTGQCMSTGRSILNGSYDGTNTTTPWVDQNQTYTSHPSKQVFLREYDFRSGAPKSTGKLLGGVDGNIANWAETKAQAHLMGIDLRDSDITEVPLIVTDEFGRFLPGPNGNPQMVRDSDGAFIEGTAASANNTDGIRKTNQAFLDDINPYAFPYPGAAADADNVITNQDPNSTPPSTYDNELLDAHFITGDGRGNENIGLTAIHTIFHSEHDRVVDDIKNTIGNLLNSGTLTAVQQNLISGFGASLDVNSASWNGERLFQAAKFVTEMEYQHIVFGEFARSVQPAITPFAAYDPTLDPTITEEFANAAYRYGHSQLNADIARTSANGDSTDIALFDGFLSPNKFNTSNTATGLTAAQSAGQIMRGMSKQTGNSIDEFVTSTLRNTLLGAPLDLATLNIARSRDTGLASLNESRAAYKLHVYTSWFDFGQHMQTIESLPNFVAAYGDLPEIKDEPSIAGKRALGQWIVKCATTEAQCATTSVIRAGLTTDAELHNFASDFLNAQNGYTAQSTGLNDIDLWMGGLAEKHQTRVAPAGGSLLGSTLDYIFKTQLENLQGSDRFYYLGRTAGMNLAGQLETNFFSELVMRNTDVRGLPANAFAVPTNTIDMSKPCRDQVSVVAPDVLTCQTSSWVYRGNQHLVWDGTDGNDTIFSGGGNDTLIGGKGSDHLNGNFGDDFLYGGEGNDFLFDDGGIDIYIGGSGDDYMEGGAGLDTFNGGSGDDFVAAGYDATTTLAGEGNDYVYGGTGADAMSGDEGDDWLDGGGTADGIIGDLLAPFVGFISSTPGNNVMIGGAGPDTTTGGDGTDINLTGDGTDLFTGNFGFDWNTAYKRGDSSNESFDLGLAVPVAGSFGLEDTFLDVEGGSGGDGNDIVIGDNRTALISITPPFTDGLLASEVDKITNLRALVNKGGNTTSEWLLGNILLGGNGSDRLTGNLGDDRIDGDAYLEVGLSIPKDKATGLSLSVAGVYQDPDNANRWITQDISLLQPLVASGELLTADIIQVKTIRPGDGASGVDTAVFAGPQANYTVTYNRTDGSITVADNVGTDGTDTLTGIEVLDFAGTLVNVSMATGVTTFGATGAARVSWTAPLTAARQAISAYVVRAYDASTGGNQVGTTCTISHPLASTPLNCVVDGLTNGVTYYVDVTTDNGFNVNTTARVAVVPVIVPDAPGNVLTPVNSATTATVTWDASIVPAGGPDVTGYKVTVTPAIAGAAQCANVIPSALTCSLTGLVQNTRYTITVAALAGGLTSLESAPITMVTPTSVVPAAPRNLAVVLTGPSAALTWRAPNTIGGGAVAPTYSVSVTSTPIAPAAPAPTFTCANQSATTCSVAALSPGYTYTFSVAATNGFGTGTAVTRTVTYVSGPPSAITVAPVVVRTGNRIRITWAAPAAMGNPATSYRVTVTPTTGAVITGTVVSTAANPSTTVRVTGTGTVTVTPLNSASTNANMTASPAATY
jgi:Ca2+-binding RTX toxin-like protein